MTRALGPSDNESVDSKIGVKRIVRERNVQERPEAKEVAKAPRQILTWAFAPVQHPQEDDCAAEAVFCYTAENSHHLEA